ncbi:MAG: glycosyltransferase family 2 protein [Vicinamibacterales bacterium]
MERPFVSVVIATRNRAALLAETLRALSRQRWPADRLEVVLVDNGSTDGTADTIAATWKPTTGIPLRYLYLREPGKSRAVNAGLAVARGQVIALTDDDAQPEPAWVDRLVGALRETGSDFVAGRMRPIWEVAPPRWMSPALFGALAVPDNGPQRQLLTRSGNAMPIGANMALTRRAVDHLGGFCESLGKLEGTLQTGEDHELFLRLLSAGYRGVYEPTAVVHHLVSASRLTPGYFRRWLYQNGRDTARLQHSYPPRDRMLGGIPRYLWREAAADAVAMARAALVRDAPQRFASSVRLAWFAGYIRETVRARHAPPARARVAVTVR